MDIAGLVNYEQEFPLELLHPGTGQPIGITFMVKSIDCAAADAAAQADAAVKVASGDGDDKAHLNIYAACISGWDWGENEFDGDVPEYSEANCRKVIKHPSSKWIVRQLQAAVANVGNFTSD